MTARQPVTLLTLLAATQGCAPHRAPLVVLSCPPVLAQPPAPPPRPIEPVAVDGPRVAALPPTERGPRLTLDGIDAWRPIASKPFTLIINNRVAAVVPADADSAVVSAAWAKLNPEKLESIEVDTGSRAQQCYPPTLGTLVVATQR